MPSLVECSIQGELQKRKHGDRKECSSINQSRRPSSVLRMNDEQNSRGKREHGSYHGEEQEGEADHEPSREVLVEISLLQWRRGDREEHYDGSQRDCKGDDIHDGEEREDGRVEENWMSLLISPSWDSVGSCENDGGDEDRYGRARSSRFLYPLLCFVEKISMFRFEELICSPAGIVSVQGIMGGHYLPHPLHGDIA